MAPYLTTPPTDPSQPLSPASATSALWLCQSYPPILKTPWHLSWLQTPTCLPLGMLPPSPPDPSSSFFILSSPFPRSPFLPPWQLTFFFVSFSLIPHLDPTVVEQNNILGTFLHLKFWFIVADLSWKEDLAVGNWLLIRTNHKKQRGKRKKKWREGQKRKERNKERREGR